jgi:hypothetical protein
MPTLNVKNPGGAEIFIDDVGTNIPASSTVPFSDRANLLRLAHSDSLRALLQAGSLILNDGVSDLSASEALGVLENIWSTSANNIMTAVIPVGFVYNARFSWDSVSQVSIGTAGQLSAAKDSRGQSNIIWSGVLTASMAVSGAGGLQTGSVEAANTWYRVLVIADSSGVNPVRALLVPEGTAFNQSGYDIFRRLGYVRNNGSSNFLKFNQAGEAQARFVLYDEDAANLTALTDGAATTPTVVSLATFVPPIGRTQVMTSIGFRTTGGAATDQLLLRPNGVTSNSPAIRVAPGALVAQKQKQMVDLFTNASQEIQYAGSNAADRTDVIVAGYYDTL